MFVGGIDLSSKNIGMSLVDFPCDGVERKPDVFAVDTVFNQDMGSDRQGLVRTVDEVMAFFYRLKVKPPLYIGVENYLMARYATSYEMVLFHGALAVRLLDAGFGFVLIHPAQLKKWVRPAKDVPKSEIIDFCTQEMDGFGNLLKSVEEVKREHVADASVLAWAAHGVCQAKLADIQPVLPYRKEVVDAVLGNKKCFFYPTRVAV